VPRESLVNQLIKARAERLAQDPKLPEELRCHIRYTAISEFRAFVSLVAGERAFVRGDDYTLMPVRRDPQRHSRILAALQAGHSVQQIARAERVSVRYVRQVRARASL
jgi:DNA-binding NarL/FixJ family response regulator